MHLLRQVYLHRVLSPGSTRQLEVTTGEKEQKEKERGICPVASQEVKQWGSRKSVLFQCQQALRMRKVTITILLRLLLLLTPCLALGPSQAPSWLFLCTMLPVLTGSHLISHRWCMPVTPFCASLWLVMLTGYLHDYYLLFYLLTLAFPLM